MNAVSRFVCLLLMLSFFSVSFAEDCTNGQGVQCNNTYMSFPKPTGCSLQLDQCIIRSCCDFPGNAVARCRMKIFWCSGGGSGGSSCYQFECRVAPCVTSCL